MRPETYLALEFNEIRRILLGFISGPPGRREVQALLPMPSRERAEEELRIFDEGHAWVESQGYPALGLPEDPQPILQRAAIEGVVLEPKEFLVLAALGRVGTGLVSALRAAGTSFPLLASRYASLPNLSRFADEIERTILPGGEIADAASPALRQIRRSIEALRQKIQDILKTYLQKDPGRTLQDQYFTERNGRYVLPIRADSPHRLEGVVHGTSSSGATLFIEPIKTVDMNNQLYRRQEEEKEEILRILGALSREVHSHLDSWRELIRAIGEVDLLCAKVRFSAAYQAVRPRLSAEGALRLVDARHPLLIEQLRGSGQPVVPISLEMGPGRQVLILSGPNTGGKTVALKTLGLATLMTACALPVAASDAEIPFFESLLVNIGDQQSIQSSLSTFSAHVLALKSIVEESRPPSLILLDEVGTGTDPEQGAALAIAVIEHLRERGCWVVATTHYNRLKVYGYKTPSVANMAVEFDAVALRPTYRLLEGVAGSSSGLEIADRLGLPDAIIRAAKGLVDPRDLESDRLFEAIRGKLAEIEELRQSLGIEQQMVESQRLELHAQFRLKGEALDKEFRRRCDEQLKQFQTDADLVLRNLRDRTEKTKERKSVERRLEQSAARARRGMSLAEGREAAPPAEEASGTLGLGDRVRIISLDQEGIVERVDLPRIEVSIAGKRWNLNSKDLRRISGPEDVRHISGSRRISEGVLLEMGSAEEVPGELQLIGLTADEAVSRTDKFLDQAMLAGRASVRLVHGFGKGILRKALAQFLAKHPHVAASRSAGPEEGGLAVTVVELRST